MPNLRLNRIDFKQALKPMLSFKSKVLPILDYCMLFSRESKDEGLGCIVYGTNLEVYIETSVEAAFGHNFQILLPIKSIYDFLCNCSDEDILVEWGSDPTNVKVSSDDMLLKFTTPEAGNMVKSIVLDSPYQGYIIASDVLSKNLKTAARFASDDELRPAMCHINLCQREGKLFYVATDAHLLLFRNSRMEYCGYDMMVNKKAARMIERVFSKVEPLVIFKRDNIIQVDGAYSKIAMKQIEDKYPQWEAVLPKDDANDILVNKARLSAVLNVCMQNSDFQHQTRFDIGKESMVISSGSNAGDTADVSAKVQILSSNQADERFTIGFNSKLFLNALSSSSDLLVKISHTGFSNKAAVLNNEVMIMPLMLNNNSGYEN